MSHYQSALIEMASLDHRDFDATLASILRTDAEVVHVDRVSYWATECDRQTLRCELGYIKSAGAYERGAVISVEDCPAYFGAIFAEKVVAASDARVDARTAELASAYLVPHGITSMMDAPVWLDGHLIGIVCHEHSGPRRPWSARDQAFALSAAQAVAMAVGARERHRVERAEKRAAFLAQGTIILAETLDLDEIPERLVGLAIPALGDWCVLDALGDYGELSRVACAHVDPSRRATLDELARRYPPTLNGPTLAARALREDNALLVPEVSEELLARDTVDEGQRELLRALGMRSVIALPLRAHGRMLGAISFMSATRTYDMDDLRLAEDLARRASIALDNATLHRQAKDAVAARDEFISVAAHELYTPLSALTLAAEQLERDCAEHGRMLRVILRSTQRLGHLVNGLLEAVRTGFRRAPIAYRHVDLAALARSVVEQLGESAERAGCRVSLDAPASVCGLWDEAGVEQVLTNLLSNAMKFGAGEPIAVEVARVGDRARVTVRDHGPGLDPAELPRLFDRFQRGVSARSYGGLGLGLYIAREIAEAHGGTLTAESEPGHGASFTLELPLTPS